VGGYVIRLCFANLISNEALLLLDMQLGFIPQAIPVVRYGMAIFAVIERIGKSFDWFELPGTFYVFGLGLKSYKGGF